MPAFVPCAGKTACTQDGSHCRGCGRSHDEIARTRAAISALTELALQQGYDNVEAFANYVSTRIVKKVDDERAVSGAA
jgi:hypothetical protein